MRRRLLPILALAFLPALPVHAVDVQPAPDQAAAWTMPADQKQRVSALIDQAIALGFPDCRGAILLHGRLQIGETSHMPTQDGLHARLADGSWLVGLCLRVMPRKGLTITEKDLKTVPPAEFLAKMRNGNPWLDQDRGEEFITPFAPQDQAALRVSARMMAATQVNTGVMVMTLGYDAASMMATNTATGIALMRLGIPDAEQALVGLGAMSQSLAFLMPRDEGALILSGNPMERMSHMQERQQGFAKTRNLQLPTPDQALRRGLLDWFTLQLGGIPTPFIALDPAQAAAGARAMLDEGDAAGRTRIDRLERAMAVPTTAPAGADLATRLASWRSAAKGGMQTMMMDNLDEEQLAQFEQMPEEAMKNMPPGIREAIAARRDGFTEQDLDALVALAGDTRPSRWIDQGTPRTVGDQALRAIAGVLHLDPRVMIRHSTTAIWTDAERAAVAKDLTAWWATHHGKPLADLMTDAIGDLKPGDLVRILKGAKKDTASFNRLFDRLAQSWKKGPPEDDRSLVNLSTVLALGDQHAGFIATVDAWPVTGDLRMLLATWHAVHGRHQHIDACLDEALAKAAPLPKEEAMMPDEMSLGSVIHVAIRFPRPEMLRRLQVILSGPLDQPATEQAMLSVMFGNNIHMGGSGMYLNQRDMNPRNHDEAGRRRRMAMPMAVFAQLIIDRRPAPESLMMPAQQPHLNMDFDDQGRPKPKKSDDRPLPKDLRIADCLGVMARQKAWELNLNLPNEDWKTVQADLAFDLRAPLAERDAALKRITDRLREVLPQALSGAGLPLAIPGFDLKPAPGEGGASLF